MLFLEEHSKVCLEVSPRSLLGSKGPEGSGRWKGAGRVSKSLKVKD